MAITADLPGPLSYSHSSCREYEPASKPVSASFELDQLDRHHDQRQRLPFDLADYRPAIRIPDLSPTGSPGRPQPGPNPWRQLTAAVPSNIPAIHAVDHGVERG
jgi:hypothetical protein